MHKFLRKNGKKIMAVMGVLLMVAFAAPTTCTQFSGRGEGDVGTLYGGKVTLTGREYQNFQGEWNFLKQRIGALPIAVAMGTGGFGVPEEQLVNLLGIPGIAEQIQLFALRAQQNPFMLMQNPEAQFMMRALQEGQYAFGQIDNNDDLFALLVKEAQANGTTVNNDTLETILQRRGSSYETDPDHQALRRSLHDLLLVINSYKRAGGVVKVSQPARRHRMASTMQEMSVNLVEFNAKDFLAQVPEPTPQQVQAHFDKYKDVLAENSPSGFGYKYPNRVKFDTVVINREQIRKAVGEIDLVDMFEYYERNKTKPEMILSTQPATRPNDDLNLSSTPASRPAATTRPKTFDEAKDQIKNTLADQRIADLAAKVRDAVRNTMVTDYNALKAVQAAAKGGTTLPAPKSSLGPAYNTFEYLQALRDKVQKEHNVTLAIERREQWQSTASMKDTDLARLSTDPQAAAQPIDFPAMMTTRLEPFVDEVTRKQMGAARVLALWEPTPLFTNELQTETVVARATAAEPTHSPKSLDEVKDKVTADTKLALAYEKAKQAAQAMVDAAKSGKWLQSVANEQNKRMITTGTFSPAGGGFFGAFEIPGYVQLKGPALAAFKTEVFKLLAQPPRAGGTAPRISNPVTPTTAPATTQATTQPATQPAAKPATAPATQLASTQPMPVPSSFKEHPVGIVELPAEGKVLAVEVDSLKAGPGWTRESESLVQMQTMVQQRMAEESQIRLQWFDPDNVNTRLNFKPANPPNNPQPRRPALPPVNNPFLGHAVP